MTYSEKLKDQRWQKRRLELLEAAGWKCTRKECENPKEKPELHVHHKVYLRGLDPWDYEDWALQVVCNECHAAVQEQMESAHVVLARMPDLMEFCVRWYKCTENVEFRNLARSFLILNDAMIQVQEYSILKAKRGGFDATKIS